jgi:hypothetical protein
MRVRIINIQRFEILPNPDGRRFQNRVAQFPAGLRASDDYAPQLFLLERGMLRLEVHDRVHDLLVLRVYGVKLMPLASWPPYQAVSDS